VTVRLFKIELSWSNLLNEKIHLLIFSMLKSLANHDNVIIYLVSEDFFFLDFFSFIVTKTILKKTPSLQLLFYLIFILNIMCVNI